MKAESVSFKKRVKVGNARKRTADDADDADDRADGAASSAFGKRFIG